MQTNPPDPESVAAGLTKAQREAIGHLSAIGKPWRFPVRWSVLVGYSLERMGLARRTFWTDKTFLTPLGLAVRAALQSKETK